jgi:hypothetical protein
MSQDPLTTERVFQHTNQKINDKIIKKMKMSVLYYEKNPNQIDCRLQELTEEWDIERYLEINASILALFGVMGGFFGKRAYLLFPITVLGFLIQHAVQGWCPPVELFRRLGIRTKEEIARERTLLRAIRGDYDSAPQLRSGDGQTQI